MQFLNSSTKLAQEWTASESAMQQELRRGLGRLEKGCAQKAPNARADAPEPDLAARMQALQESLATRERRRSAFERPAGQWSAEAADLVARQCTGVSAALGLSVLKSAQCRRAEAVEQGVKGLRTELARYLDATIERYRSYTLLARVEQQGCTRPGFTARLIQANEVHMQPAEARQLDLIDQWSRQMGEQIRSAGDQP